jgi:hypothetical protein
MLFQVGASLMVYKSVREKKVLWLLGAVLGHTALDAFAVYGVKTLDLVLLEGIIFIFSLFWIVWSWMIRVRDQEFEEERAPLLPEIRPSGSVATSRQLEESRYE